MFKVRLISLMTREVMLMTTYEILSLVIAAGMFVLALLTYLKDRDKRK